MFIPVERKKDQLQLNGSPASTRPRRTVVAPQRWDSSSCWVRRLLPGVVVYLRHWLSQRTCPGQSAALVFVIMLSRAAIRSESVQSC